ncbi:MAG: hypothetical protein JST40_03595 [Armatimonadetes bacterium]|nr:hypothetical protein [Armatimonadota bacterium]
MIFGRTNQDVPMVWIRPHLPEDLDEIEPMKQALRSCQTVIDITLHPALWGGALQGTEATILKVFGRGLGLQPDSGSASTHIEAELIETLSSISRSHIDFYALQFDQALEEFQLEGAFRLLEEARADGLISHLGLFPKGSLAASLTFWHFNDAFDFVVLEHDQQEKFSVLAQLAKGRRVGIVEVGGSTGANPVIRAAKSAQEIEMFSSIPR